MVMIMEGGHLVDKYYLFYIQAGNSAVFLGGSMSPSATLLKLQEVHFLELTLLTERVADPDEVQKTREALGAHHIARGWFAPSPEVMEYARGHLVVGDLDVRVARGRKGKGGRKLDEEAALEIFRLYHVEKLEQRFIAARYGVSMAAVGLIARGESYSGLFRRVAAGDNLGGWYVSLAADPAAPRYWVASRKGEGKGPGVWDARARWIVGTAGEPG